MRWEFQRHKRTCILKSGSESLCDRLTESLILVSYLAMGCTQASCNPPSDDASSASGGEVQEGVCNFGYTCLSFRLHNGIPFSLEVKNLRRIHF